MRLRSISNITATGGIPPDRQRLIHALQARRIVPLNGAVMDILENRCPGSVPSVRALDHRG